MSWGKLNTRRGKARDRRRRRIAELWRKDPTLSTRQLVKILDTPERTIWRDRAALKDQGIVPLWLERGYARPGTRPRYGRR